MPLYEYECRCGERMEAIAPFESRPDAIRCECGGMAKWVISAPAIHTIGTFSRSIDDADVRKSIACDGSYVDPTLSYHPETGKLVAPITSERQRQRLIAERGLFEKPPSDKARDVQRLKRTKPIHFV